MKIKLLAFISIFFHFLISSFAQSTEFRHRVWIGSSRTVLKKQEVPNADSVILPIGTITKYEKKYKFNGKDYTAEVIDTIDRTNDTILVVKEIEKNVSPLPGWAYVSPDKDDKSILHINYWLSGKDTTFEIGTLLQFEKNGKPIIDTLRSRTTYTLNSYPKAVFDRVKLEKSRYAVYADSLKKIRKNVTPLQNAVLAQAIQSLEDTMNALKLSYIEYSWYDNSNEKVVRLDSKGDTLALFAKKYDRDGKYYIKLKNREYVRLWFRSIELGAMTIPFKYRNGYKVSKERRIDSDLTADLNIGTYLGYSFGQVTHMYRKNEEKSPSKWLTTIGPFFNLSRVEIDSSSTLSQKKPLTKKVSVATFSPGLALMTSIYNFRAGVFVGKEYAFGATGRKWDYHDEWWFGVGVGYNLGFIWGVNK